MAVCLGLQLLQYALRQPPSSKGRVNLSRCLHNVTHTKREASTTRPVHRRSPSAGWPSRYPPGQGSTQDSRSAALSKRCHRSIEEPQTRREGLTMLRHASQHTHKPTLHADATRHTNPSLASMGNATRLVCLGRSPPAEPGRCEPRDTMLKV